MVCCPTSPLFRKGRKLPYNDHVAQYESDEKPEKWSCPAKAALLINKRKGFYENIYVALNMLVPVQFFCQYFS